jgi:hypothetical protein
MGKSDMTVRYHRAIALSAILVVGAGAMPDSGMSATAPSPAGAEVSTVTPSGEIPGPVRRIGGRFAILVPLIGALVLLVPGVLERLVFIGAPRKVDP